MPFTYKDWNLQQKAVRAALKSPDGFETAVDLVLNQHAWTHQGSISGAKEPTFADQLWDGLDADTIRAISPKGEHSIAWCLYHLARIEDTALSILMAGKPMLLDEGGWGERLKVRYRDTGNGMTIADIQKLSDEIDVESLKDYRAAVGMRSRGFIKDLTRDRLKVTVRPEQIQQIVDLGAVRPEASGLLEFWSKRTMEGLLLMPATRHNMVHINEALRLKERIMRRKK